MIVDKKHPAIIVDLDGTLCNTKHRQHFMEPPTKDWRSFYKNLVYDEPNEWCEKIIERMTKTHAIILVSGRPDTFMCETRRWLADHLIEYDLLFMRKEGDFRKDAIVKTEIYNFNIKDKYDVLFCIDDRQQVVDAWRELGLTCLQCAKGNF